MKSGRKFEINPVRYELFTMDITMLLLNDDLNHEFLFWNYFLRNLINYRVFF